MKTIYLYKNYEWYAFDYDAESTKVELINRGIIIGEGVVIREWAMIGEWAEIGKGARIGEGVNIERGTRIEEGVNIERGVTIGRRAKIGSGADIAISPFYATGLYDLVTGAYWSKGVPYIQLGCNLRTRKEWEGDFWNNPEQFPNDGSPKSNKREFAFKVACQWLDFNKPN